MTSRFLTTWEPSNQPQPNGGPFSVSRSFRCGRILGDPSGRGNRCRQEPSRRQRCWHSQPPAGDGVMNSWKLWLAMFFSRAPHRNGPLIGVPLRGTDLTHSHMWAARR